MSSIIFHHKITEKLISKIKKTQHYKNFTANLNDIEKDSGMAPNCIIQYANETIRGLEFYIELHSPQDLRPEDFYHIIVKDNKDEEAIHFHFRVGDTVTVSTLRHGIDSDN